MKSKLEIIQSYFEGQNNSDANSVVSLFDQEAEVFNVNFPKFSGKDGLRNFCENLYARTSKRKFEILDILENEGIAMCEWKAVLAFKPGAVIGPFELENGFEVSLRGVNKFEFNEQNYIQCLRIYHETSTVSSMAQQNSKKSVVSN